MRRTRRSRRMRRGLSFDSYDSYDSYGSYGSGSSYNSHDLDNYFDNNDDYDDRNEFKISSSRTSNYKKSFNNISFIEKIKNYYIDHKSINFLNILDDDDNVLNLLNNENSFDNKIRMKSLIEIEKIKYIENKHDYFTKKKIYSLLTYCGAGIFGGSIRDSIIHDYGSNKFYEYINNNFDYISNVNLIYGDKKFHPESYKDRNLIFNDIDTIMSDDHFKAFLLQLDLLFIKYSYIKYHDLTKYIDIDDLENLISSYIVLNITIDNPCNNIYNKLMNLNHANDLGINIIFNKFKQSYFKIDILISKENIYVKHVLDKITSNSDFYCNSIYLFNNKLEINEDIAKKLKEPCYDTFYEDNIKQKINIFLKKEIFKADVIDIVKKQILERKAISINLSKKTQKRINKIENKGFKIIYFQDIYEYVICKDEICILCRDDINSNIFDSTLSIKFKCCNSYYHKDCLLKIKNTEIYKNCFYCSKKLDYKYLNKSLNT